MVRNRRNVALLFAVYFLQGLCFYSPVATLYRLEAGLTLFQTGLLESISLAAMLLLEIPWGRAADRIGHRRTLVICSALFALSKVVFWKARAFPDFLAERLILAVALAGLSGCDSAYLFACVGEKESQRIFGLWNAVQTAGLLVAGMSASLFLSEHYRRGALWTVLSYSAAALLTLLLTDPEEDGEKPAATAPRPGMGGLLRRSLSMTPFLAGSALLAETAQFITVFLSQLLYQRAGLPVRAFGWLSMLATLCALAGARSHRLTRRLGRRRGGALLFLCAGAACLTALCPAPLPAVAGVLGLRAAAALFSPERRCRAGRPGCAALLQRHGHGSGIPGPEPGLWADGGCGMRAGPAAGRHSLRRGIAALFGGVKAGRKPCLIEGKQDLGAILYPL